jgi:protein-disulfide isomerase
MIRTGILSIALLLVACRDGDEKGAPIAAPAPAIPAPDSREWTDTVEETPEGGFRMGNPDAPVKLVEYASLTCPHCAKFSRQATEPLMSLVKSGHLSWEFRHYLMFSTDPPVSLLVRCGGARNSFALTETLYANQSDWSDKLEDISSAELERIRALPPRAKPGAMAKSAGLDRLLRQRGIPQGQIDACLADEQGAAKLEALTRKGKSEGVRGTPSLFINGRMVSGAGSWKALRPELQGALAARPE